MLEAVRHDGRMYSRSKLRLFCLKRTLEQCEKDHLEHYDNATTTKTMRAGMCGWYAMLQAKANVVSPHNNLQCRNIQTQSLQTPNMHVQWLWIKIRNKCGLGNCFPVYNTHFIYTYLCMPTLYNLSSIHAICIRMLTCLSRLRSKCHSFLLEILPARLSIENFAQ